MLARNKASMAGQTCANWGQTFLVDDVGRGIGWSNLNMAAYAERLQGDYVWILDDDDECIRPTLVKEVQEFAADDPEVIWVRMDHGPRGILPGRNWGQAPVHADIGVSAYIVRRDVWQAAAEAWTMDYHADFLFASKVYEMTTRHVWHDVIASRVQRISVGAPE